MAANCLPPPAGQIFVRHCNLAETQRQRDLFISIVLMFEFKAEQIIFVLFSFLLRPSSAHATRRSAASSNSTLESQISCGSVSRLHHLADSLQIQVPKIKKRNPSGAFLLLITALIPPPWASLPKNYPRRLTLLLDLVLQIWTYYLSARYWLAPT